MSQQKVDDSVILDYLKRGMTYSEIVTATSCGKNRIARIAKLNNIKRAKGCDSKFIRNFYPENGIGADTDTSYLEEVNPVPFPKIEVNTEAIILMKALKRRIENLKMNGKEGILKELNVIIDLL